MAGLVYIYKQSGDGGKELRHSLRSLSNLKGKHTITLVGDTENWLKDVTYIKASRRTHSPYADVWYKLMEYASRPDTPDEFWVMQDDIFFTKKQSLTALYDGELPAEGRGIHKRGLVRTREALNALKKPTRNYDIHVPFRVEKEKLKEIFYHVQKTMQGVPIQWRSFYGNYFDVGGEQYEDKKTRTMELLKGDIISTLFYTPELEQMFSEPSQYEGSGEQTEARADWTVSVVIPAYNASKDLKRCLDSIPDHKFIKEVIVYNDGSTDDTLKIMKQWEKDNKDRFNINLIDGKENRGVGYAFNRLIDANTSDYILRMDSDDYFTDKMPLVLDMINGTDIIYFNMTDNKGHRHDLDHKLKLLTVACCHIYKSSLIGDTRCKESNWGEDRDIFVKLLAKRPTELFTHIDAYHYNFPRPESLTGIRMARRDGKFSVQEPRLNLFTNCHLKCTTEPTIFETYESYVKTFGKPKRLTIYCDPNPHAELYEEYSKQIEDYFGQPPVKTKGLADGYKHSLDNADTEYLFQLEADWKFQNIRHSLLQIIREQKKDMKMMMLFNQHKNTHHSWLSKWQSYFKQSRNPMYCLSDRVSNNPHIIEVEAYRREAMHLVDWTIPGAGMIEQVLEKKFQIAIYGAYGLAPTIVHLDSRKGEKKLVW